MMKKYGMLIAAALVFGGSSAWAEDRLLLNDTGLEEQGITFEATYIGEFFRNFNLGATAVPANKKQTIYQDLTDVSLGIDLGKAGAIPGGTLFVHALRAHGSDPTASVVGDMQGVSNIENPKDETWIHEVWYEQAFGDGVFSVLLGLYDLNADFYVSEYGSLFLNGSFGIGPEVGNVAASLYPRAALAARVKFAPVDTWYIQVAGFDGDPATRALKAAEGKMYVAETGGSNADGSYKVGYWLHTADLTGPNNNVNYSSNSGAYAVLDQTISRWGDDSSMGMFLQFGQVPSGRNTIQSYWGAGAHVKGLIESRADDEAGIAVANAKQSVGGTESTYELTYKVALAPWLSLQPSFQYVRNPNGNANSPAVKVGLLRFEVAL